VFSDANGQYIGVDNAVHTVASGHAQYANYSGWDIYRSQAQFIGMIAPSQASDVAQSAVNDYAQSTRPPKWSQANGESYVMVGDPADAIIADIYAFGGKNFDTTAAKNAMIHEATVTNNDRPGLNYLDSIGYLPSDGSYGCCNYYGLVSGRASSISSCPPRMPLADSQRRGCRRRASRATVRDGATASHTAC
jgi:putative alpha-1,2-mannosidase